MAFGATRTITGNETETCLRVEGTLVITSTGHLTVDTIDVGETGVLDFEPGFEVTINDATINLTDDSEQWGHGIVVRGTASMQGTPLTCTWLGLTSALTAGATTLNLTGSPATCGWQNGDRIVLPDTRQLWGSEQDTQFHATSPTGRWEERTIASMSGSTLTLNTALTYDHPCARNAANTQCDFYAHVMNLTRDSVIRSESATGTRGHIICVDDAVCDIQYVQLNDLGRTLNQATECCDLGDNVIGRYPLHAHHMTTSPVFVGNAIDNGPSVRRQRWAIAIHNTDGGTITDNTIYNYAGAFIMLEDGNENDNVLARNFGIRSMGDGSSSRADQSPGNEGSGFWIRGGSDNYFYDNIVANTALYGYTFFQGGPFYQFEDNISYGGRRGFTMWEINGASTGSPNMDAPHSTLLNFVSWHDFDGGMPLHYPAFNIIFDGLQVRCDASLVGGQNSTGFTSGDYQTLDFTIRNANIQGCRAGIHTSMKVVDRDSTFTVEDSYLHNYFNIEVHSMAGPGGGGGSQMDDQLVVLRNITHDSLADNGNIRYSDDTPIPATPIRMFYQANGNPYGAGDSGGLNGNLQVTHDVYVYDHDGNTADDFRLYWSHQAASAIMPQTGSVDGLIACPSSGLTNAQCLSMHGVTSFGSIPTCEDTRADVLNGFACAISSAANRKPRPLRRPYRIR